jgi:hypothetical protein
MIKEKIHLNNLITLTIILIIINFTQPINAEKTPHPIYGYAACYNGSNVYGSTVEVTSSEGTLYTTVGTSDYWQVDCGTPGAGWNTGTDFIVTITIPSGWSNNTSGTVNSHSNYVGTIIIEYPTPISLVTDEISNWNLMSIPTNQSIDKTNFLIKYNGLYYSWLQAYTDDNQLEAPLINQHIFGWNRNIQSYIFTNSLEPGYGYWIYAYENCEIWTQGIINTPNEVNLTNLEKYWNIIGLPDNQQINKTDIIVNHNNTDYSWDQAVSNNIINNYIFGWNRNGQYYSFNTIINPGYAYWIFAYIECKLKIP